MVLESREEHVAFSKSHMQASKRIKTYFSKKSWRGVVLFTIQGTSSLCNSTIRGRDRPVAVQTRDVAGVGFELKMCAENLLFTIKYTLTHFTHGTPIMRGSKVAQLLESELLNSFQVSGKDLLKIHPTYTMG